MSSGGGILPPFGGSYMPEFPVADAQVDDIFFTPDDTHYIGYDSGGGVCARPREIYATREVGIGGVATDPILGFYNDGDCQFGATPLSIVAQLVATASLWGYADPLLIRQNQTTGNILAVSNLADGSGADSFVILADVNVAAITADHNILTLAWADDGDVVTESTYFREFEMRFNTAAALQLFGSEADSATAVGCEIGTEVSFLTAGSKLASFLNNTDEQAFIDYRGELGLHQLTNGQGLEVKVLTELTTIAAAATTDTTIQIPAGAQAIAASARVVTVIPTATTFDIGVAVDSTRYGDGIAVAAGTTHRGTNDGIRYYDVATSIRITPDATPAAGTGQVRITIHYIVITPPTS